MGKADPASKACADGKSGFLLLFFSVVLVFTFRVAFGETYYVDATRGSDAADGLSPATAWQSISKVNAGTFKPGDSILFKRGETWREELKVPGSGNAQAHFTFGAYGEGPRPIISGADLVAEWTNDGPHRWKATAKPQPHIVLFDRAKGKKENSKDKLNAAGEWYWTDGTLYIYSESEPGETYTSPGIEAGVRDTCIDLNDKNYVTFDNLHLYGANDESWRGVITDWYSGNVPRAGLTVSNCEIACGADEGIRLALANPAARFTGIKIFNNSIHHFDSNQAWGIHLFEGNGKGAEFNCDIYNNTIYNCYQGIRVQGARNSRIHENEFYNNGRECDILPGPRVSNIEIYRNYHHDSTGEAVWIGTSDIENVSVYYNVVCGLTALVAYVVDQGAKNVSFYNNTIYGCENSAFCIGNSGRVTGVVMKNNLVYTVGIGSNVEYRHDSRFISENNCWDPDSSFWDADARTTRDWAYWTGTLGHDAHGLYEVAGMKAPEKGDFTLRPGSPCIDAGADVGLRKDHAGNKVPQGDGVDIGAFEYSSPD